MDPHGAELPTADGAKRCGSYDDPTTRGVGTSTPSQTAWAILGLLAAGDNRSDSVAKGIHWLLSHQQATERGTRASGKG